MSVYTANSIKDKLLTGIDSDGNIVDMGVVLDVLKILESFELSKDDLEETRIGRYVNSMRKRTNDSVIAKKSKSLIKKWQAVVEQAVTTTSVVSGSLSNPGVPSSHISNHRRKLDDNESVANSNCDSSSPVSSAVGNGQFPKVVSVATNKTSKTGISLRIKLGKSSGAVPPETNDSSLSPATPPVRNGPQGTGPPEKQQRRIKSTAEIAKELEEKRQLNLSSEIKEKLEKQRTEMPLHTINEPIPAPVLSFSHDRKQRGKKRGTANIEYDNSPSPRTMLMMASLHSNKGVVDASEDSRSAISTSSTGKLLSAEKSEMVKRFLDSSVTPSEMPLTPASGHQSVTSELDSSGPSVEDSLAFPGDYTRLSTKELYKFLSATFRHPPVTETEGQANGVEEGEQQPQQKISVDAKIVCQPDSRLPGITGIAASTGSSSFEANDNRLSKSASVEEWTRWEECVTLVSDDADKRPVFILPFVDIPDTESQTTKFVQQTDSQKLESIT